MRKFEEVRLPTEAEKNRSIRHILDCGMPEPQRLFTSLPELYKSIGLKGLFFGVEDCIFLSMLIAVLAYLCLIAASVNNSSVLSVLVFLTSPFLYALLHLLTVWKEIMAGTYELKMVCRYSFRQMTALRMLAFGGISVLMTVLLSTGLWFAIAKEISALRMMSISFSALFLFAAAELASELRWSAPTAYFSVPAIWCISGILLLAAGERAEQILRGIPTAVFLLIAVCAAALFSHVLQRYYFSHKEGAIARAVR